MSDTSHTDDKTPLASLLGKSVAVTLIRIVGLGLGFGISVHVARALGDAEFGRYESWLAWIGIASVFLGLGSERMIARFVATYLGKNDLARLRGLLRPVGRLSVLLTFAAVAALLLPLLGNDDIPLWLAGVAAVLGTVAFRSVQAVLTGLGAVTWSQALDLLALPIAFWIAFAFWTGLAPSNAEIALGSQATSVLAGLALAGMLAWRRRPRSIDTIHPIVEWNEWRTYSRSLLALAILQIGLQRTDLAVFDLVGDDAALGHYAAAKRIAGPVVAIVLAVNAAGAPWIARLHARGEMQSLQSMLTKMARATTAVAIALSIPLLTFGDWILSWFGPQFPEANTALRVLVAAQVVNSACGSVLLVLIMTGHASAALPGLAIANVLQAGLASWLTRSMGATGAALAAAAGTVTWNLILSTTVWRRLHLDASVLGRAMPVSSR